jgi:hypothetical protein
LSRRSRTRPTRGPVVVATRDLDDPKFLEAFVIRDTPQLAMAGNILFSIPNRGLDERLYRIRAKTVLIWGESDHRARRACPDRGRTSVVKARA